jgi:hypothetical protein
VAAAAELLVQLIHPFQVARLALVETADRRQRRAVHHPDHSHLGMEGEARQPVPAGRAGVHGGREHSRPVAGVSEDGVHELPADPGSLVVGQDAVGREVPEASAVLREREAGDHALLRGDPAARGIDFEVEAHALEPPLRGRRGARLSRRLVRFPAEAVRLEERRVGCTLSRHEVSLLHGSDLHPDEVT